MEQHEVDEPAEARPKQAPLIDVTQLPFAALRARKDTPLARSLQQVIASLDDPNGVISAFQSFADDKPDE